MHLSIGFIARRLIGTIASGLLLLAVAGCPGGGAGSNANSNPQANSSMMVSVISSDTTFGTANIARGRAVMVENNAVVTITGDANIDGTLSATDGRLTLKVGGNLNLNGTLSAVHSGTPDFPDDTPLNQQPAGIYVIVGQGGVTLGSGAVLQTNGSYVITDDEAVLMRTPRELSEDTTNVSGDNLPTLAPLDPENPAVGGAPRVSAPLDSTIARHGELGPLQGGGIPLAPVVVTGMWPPAGGPVPAGDMPVVIVRFNGPRDVIVRDWTFTGPAAPGRPAVDMSGNPSTNASGRNGRGGQSLNIRNEGGSVRVEGTVTLNLANGGPGDDAMAMCASATGGIGGPAGNLRISGSEGIDISNGMLVINPGRGGPGGNATVMGGTAASGCPGANGMESMATGGNGARNAKALLQRGNVSGIENVTIGDLVGGAGGSATATGCDGGDGDDCCDGGNGGNATGRGGHGGDASLNVRGLAVAAGSATGGDGGTATATGGDGGEGGDCKFDDAGNGGDAGMATATGGAGGGGAAVGAGIPNGGDGGAATSTGGDGGDGGDSGFGTAGAGGARGGRSAVAGAAGSPNGAAGQPTTNDGQDGLDGGQLSIRLYCFGFAFVLANNSNVIMPGTQSGPVTQPGSNESIGMLSVEFVASSGAQYFKGTDPVPHVGVTNGTLSIRTSSLQLAMPPGTIGGLRLAPLFANGISEMNPLMVQALDANGGVIATRSFATLPNNSNSAGNPQTVDATFDVTQSVAEFRIIAPPNSFVTIIQIYLLDP